MGAWVHECRGAGVHGCMGAWVHGCRGAGVHGCMGSLIILTRYCATILHSTKQ
jgi:hypothetical protein